MTILGISVGTSRTGICVLTDGVLLDRQLHYYNDPWSDNKLKMILNKFRSYIQKRNVSAIMLKIPPTKKQSSAVRRLMRRIEALAKEYGSEFDFTTKDELMTAFNLSKSSDLIKYALLLYPELSIGRSVHAPRKKVYEAILAAHFYHKRLKSKAEQTTNTTE